MDILITGPSLADQGGVASYYNSVLPYLRKQDDFDIHYMEIGGTAGAGKILHPVADQIRFRQALNRIKPAIVHVNPSLDPQLKSYIRDGLFVLQASRRGSRVIVFFHGWDEKTQPVIEASWLWFFRMTYLKADAFIVLASAFRDKLMKWGVTAPIHLGTTTISSDLVSNFSITEKTQKLVAGTATKVLFLARLDKEKGVMEAMQAVTMLRVKGSPITLTIAGDGPAMDAVKKYVIAYDVKKEFLFVVGDVRGDEKRSLFATHHIYCLPSIGEGMPTSVLEAMAFGMPVITCPVGGLRDFFENGKMGYLVKQKTVTDIADALERLEHDRPAMMNMSTYNHHYAMERFLAPSVAEKLMSIYRRTASRSGLFV